MATELQVCSVKAVYQDKSADGKYSIYYNVTSYPTYVTISGYGYISLSKSDSSGYEDAMVSNGAVSIGGTSVASGKSGRVYISGSVLSDYEKPFTFTRNVSRDHSAKSVAIAASGTLSVNGNFGDSTKTGSTSANVSVPAKPSYAVSYNANGGTNGMPSAQTKWHDESLTLQADNGYRKVVSEAGEPTKEYVLSSWNTKADGTGTTYALGGTYTGNAAITLYAVWELKYIYPTITNLKVYRTATSSISDVDEDDLGEYIFVSFDWTKCSEDGSNLNITPNCKITINSDEYTPTLTSGFIFKSSATYSSDASVSLIVELYDQSYASSRAVANENIGTSILPIDLYGSGTNVYMGIMTPHISGQKLTLPNPDDVYVETIPLSEYVGGGGGGGGVTGVKGNDESTYRTGNVNLTPANIGAVPTTRTVNGHALSSNVTVTASDIGVESGAEVNQNAFSNVKVGSTTISADTKTDTLEIEAGSNVTLTPDATNDKVTISATDTTYSDATASASGLMSATDKSKLDTIEHYGVCNTNPATAAKTVTISGVTELYTGLTIAVKFTGTNSIANPTLNVNSLGAKAIKRYGTTAPSTSVAASWCAGSVVTLTYDGQYWQMHDWNNTTYSVMPVAEMETGTATTGRVITAARLKAAVEYHAPVTSVAGQTGDVTLATVATSGSYNDLTNKPTLFSGDYDDLTNKPTIPVAISDLSNDMVYDLGAITVSGGQFNITTAQRTAIASMWAKGLCAVTATINGDTFYGIKERTINYSSLDFYGFVGASAEINAYGTPVSGTFFIGICTTLDVGLCGDIKNLTSDDVETLINAEVSNFKTISVAGQSNVEAGNASDTLILSAGSGISIATNSNAKTITISSTGGGGSGTSTPTANTLAEFDSTAHMNSTDMTASEVSDFVDSLEALPSIGNAYLWKTLSRTGTSHPSGANYWGIDTFPAKAGYTRKIGFCSSSNSSVAIVGYYFNGDTVILRTYNMSSSTVSVDLVCTAVYIRDDLVWS